MMTKYAGPWAAGMQTVPDSHGRVYRVFRAPAVRDGSPEEQGIGPPIADALCVANVGPYARGADMVFELDENDAPDFTDPATVGALAEAVRVRLHRPFLETQVGADRNFYIVDFAPENEPQESPDWPTMHLDGTFGNNLKPEVCGANRGLAWLAAYHAHRDAAGTTANDIEVIRA